MKTWKKITLLLALLGILISIGLSQILSPGYGLRNLNLTDDQWEEIDKIRLEHQKEMINLRSDLDRAYLELDRLYEQNDSKKIKGQLERINRLKTRMDEEIVDFRAEISARLTPEQQKIFNSYGWGDRRGMNYTKRGYNGVCNYGYHKNRQQVGYGMRGYGENARCWR